MLLRLLICGGRNQDEEEVANWLEKYALSIIKHKLNSSKIKISCIIHGDAKGADRGGKLWAKRNKFVIREFPANWDQYGKAAGLIRNTQMLQEGKPNLIMAFSGGRGTANMIRQAKNANLPVIELDENFEVVVWRTGMRKHEYQLFKK
jgi:hypothetical protein